MLTCYEREIGVVVCRWVPEGHSGIGASQRGNGNGPSLRSSLLVVRRIAEIVRRVSCDLQWVIVVA